MVPAGGAEVSLRDYQSRAVGLVRSAWDRGERRVLLVAPTGSGKSVMAEALVRGETGPVLVVAHRVELVEQFVERFGDVPSVTVRSVQTLRAHGAVVPAGLVVLDEAHHYVADDWSALAAAYPSARVVGLTATPERGDGRAMGSAFDALVVAAHYSELLRDGHLVPCRVYQPPPDFAKGLALDPVAAWLRYADGSRGFAFTRDVASAVELAERLTAAGVRAAAVHQGTPARERSQSLRALKQGALHCLTSVYALTEGVDVPAARVCMLARSAGSAATYLQIAGRVLRPAHDKTDAILIDLGGASLVHGLPTDDRVYSLEGEAIRSARSAGIRNCTACGCTYRGDTCPECGTTPEPERRPEPRIWSHELREVFAGSDTPDDAKSAELARLRKLAAERGWSFLFVQREYKKLFGADPVATTAEREQEYRSLAALAERRGYARGYAAARYRQTFGAWPDRRWQR